MHRNAVDGRPLPLPLLPQGERHRARLASDGAQGGGHDQRRGQPLRARPPTAATRCAGRSARGAAARSGARVRATPRSSCCAPAASTTRSGSAPGHGSMPPRRRAGTTWTQPCRALPACPQVRRIPAQRPRGEVPDAAEAGRAEQHRDHADPAGGTRRSRRKRGQQQRRQVERGQDRHIEGCRPEAHDRAPRRTGRAGRTRSRG